MLRRATGAVEYCSRGNDRPIRVLYIEDDARLARLTLEYLTLHGLEVHLVS